MSTDRPATVAELRELVGIVRVHIGPNGDRDALRDLDAMFARLNAEPGPCGYTSLARRGRWCAQPRGHEGEHDAEGPQEPAAQLPLAAPASQPAAAIIAPECPGGAETGPATPPPDEPGWPDVRAEWAPRSTLRTGDRWWSPVTRAWHEHDGGVELTGTMLVWIKRKSAALASHPARKPAAAPVQGASEAQTADVLGRELRVGDVVIAEHELAGWLVRHVPQVVREPSTWPNARTYRVRVPRPEPESANGDRDVKPENVPVEPGAVPYSGSRFVSPTPGVTIGAIAPEARELMDDILTAWETWLPKLRETIAGTDHPQPLTSDEVYGFVYWLCRWSGLIRPASAPAAPVEAVKIAWPESDEFAHVAHLNGQPRVSFGRFGYGPTNGLSEAAARFLVAAINRTHAESTAELRAKLAIADADALRLTGWHHELTAKLATVEAARNDLMAKVTEAGQDRRELRERLESVNSALVNANSARDAAIARAEAAVRVIDAARKFCSQHAAPEYPDKESVLADALADYDATRKAGE